MKCDLCNKKKGTLILTQGANQIQTKKMEYRVRDWFNLYRGNKIVGWPVVCEDCFNRKSFQETLARLARDK